MKPRIRKRVWAEIEQVNRDFFNLRTVISPDPDDDTTRFYFVILPNDGATAHLALVGNFYIPENYPQHPPIVQLFTPTQRYNVDVFRSHLQDKTHSTMCFDILRPESQNGSWRSDLTLSGLFASLMSALVSYQVTQQNGADRPELVSMERLRKVKEDARITLERYQDRIPSIPDIPLVEAKCVPAMNFFRPQILDAGKSDILTSEPIYLQTGSDDVYSFAVDLSNLHSNIIFSVILSTSFTDFLGREPETVLVRNGVTATAARKRAGEGMKWFYHGKPMNDGDMRLHVTIGRDQMTFAYYSEGKLYVHGDCPVSKLNVGEIGDVRGKPFYVHIYTKNKASTRWAEDEPAAIEVLDIEGKGWIYESGFDNEGNDFGFEKIHAGDVETDEEKGEPKGKISGLMARLSLR